MMREIIFHIGTPACIRTALFLIFLQIPGGIGAAYAQNPGEFRSRRERLMENVGAETIIITGSAPEALRNDDVYHEYRQSSNFYYLTGFREPGAVLLLSPGRKLYDRETRAYLKEMLFIQDFSPLDVIWNGPRTTVKQAAETMGFECVKPAEAYEAILTGILADAPEIRIDTDFMSPDGPVLPHLLPLKAAQENLMPFSLASIREKLGRMREVKSPSEIENIRKAIAVTGEALDGVLKSLKTGMYEYEMEALIEYVFRKNGSERPGFPSIVGSGINTCYLHYVDNNRKIAEGDLVLMDIGAEWNMYSADVTRTIPASGRFSPRQKILYELTLRAGREAIKIVKPGIGHKEVHARAVEILSQGMLDLGLIRDKKDFRKYYMHGTSHFLGLDVHDITVSDTLTAGMVITVEPGIYISEEETGIRIEDDVLVTDTGYELLTAGIPVTVSEIEELMKR